MAANNMNNLIKLRNLLMRAWENKQMVWIIPGEIDVLRVIVHSESGSATTDSEMALPDESSLIAALVEGLEKVLEEADRG